MLSTSTQILHHWKGSANNIQKSVPWLKDFAIRELVVIIFSTLFVPSGRLIVALDSLQGMKKNYLLQCAHIRYGYSAEFPHDKSLAQTRGTFNTTAVSLFFIHNAESSAH